MKAFKYEHRHYAGSDVESIAPTINSGYIFLTIVLAVLFVQKLLEQDYNLSAVLLASILFSIFIRHQFLKGHLEKSVALGVTFFTVFLTIVCTIGNGINDIAIIGYPIIIGFSGIILDQRKLTFASVLCIISVVWLVVGERFKIYIPDDIQVGDIGDFFAAASLIFIGGFVGFSLSYNMKRSLKIAQLEILTSKKDAKKLQQKTNEKMEIIEEIHRAVINSLRHIQLLIEHQQKGSEELTIIYEGLKRKVLVIEVAHNILLDDQAPIMLDIREITEKLLLEYEKSIKTSVMQIDLGNDSLFVRLDLAINYGICLLELINEVDHTANKGLNIYLSIKNECVNLRISDFTKKEKKDQGIVMELLTKQLRGELKKSPNEIDLTFSPTTK